MDSTVSVKDGNKGTRKRSKQITDRQRKKIVRYSNHFQNLENFEKSCNHKTGSSYKCNNLTIEDITRARDKFFIKTVKAIQDVKLSQLIRVKKPKRTGRLQINKNARPQKHSVHVTYTMRTSHRIIKVCKKLFLAAFDLSYRSILGIAKKIKDGQDLDEKRGGDHRSHQLNHKRDKVGKDIKKEKKQDVTSLLKSYFGEEWRKRKDLTWYKELIDTEIHYNSERNDLQTTEECDCEEEDCGIRV